MRLLAFFVFCVALASGELRGHLSGFEGCSRSQKDFIVDAWRDTQGVMDLIRNLTIDWNEPAAVDFLGPAAYNKNRQGDIQAILNNLGTATESATSDWQVHIRCDDWRKACGDGRWAAYVNLGSNEDIMGLCDSFFKLPLLSTTIETAKTASNPKYSVDLSDYYSSSGDVILHELLHMNCVHMSGKYGSNRRVYDWVIQFKDPDEPAVTRKETVYGPKNAKIFARYNSPSSLGDFIVRSDDNLVFYPLAKYVQQELGVYPHLPLVNTQPLSLPVLSGGWLHVLVDFRESVETEVDLRTVFLLLIAFLAWY